MFTHNIDPVLIDLYIVEIRWYSLAYIFGILLGWLYAKNIIKRLKSNSSLSYLDTKDFITLKECGGKQSILNSLLVFGCLNFKNLACKAKDW